MGFNVCLGLAYLAKLMCNRCVEDLGLFWQPCQTVHVISAPLVAQMLLGSAVLGASVRSSPDSPGLQQGGDHGCLSAAKANEPCQWFPSELLTGTSCQKEK